jgi:hypothetical protein
MDEISAAEFKTVLSLISRMGDWFGKLTSGVPQLTAFDRQVRRPLRLRLEILRSSL